MALTNTQTLADQCTQQIINLIRKGHYPTGERLSEIRLSEDLDMGRAPIRAALDQLAQGGLVTRIPRAGTFVARISIENYRDLMEIREALEGMAARNAARRIAPPELSNLEKMARNYDKEREERKMMNNHSKMLELDQIFHHRLAEIGNQEVTKILEKNYILERSFLNELSMGQPFWEEYPEDYPTHLHLVEVLGRRNPDEAEAMVRLHISMAKEAQVKALFQL